ANPRPTAEHRNASPWKSCTVSAPRMPQTAVPGDEAASRSFDSNRLCFNRRMLRFIVAARPTALLTAGNDARAAVLDREVVENEQALHEKRYSGSALVLIDMQALLGPARRHAVSVIIGDDKV